MLEFNELRITPDGKCLIVDVQVKDEDYYTNVFLDSIVIDNQGTYLSSGPSSKPIFSYTVEDSSDLIYSLPEDCNCNPVLENEDKSYCYTYNSNNGVRHLRLYLSYKDLAGTSLCDNILFVYAIAKGTPSADTPCGRDNATIMGTVICLYPYYRNLMYYLNELGDDCTIPKNLIDYILRFKAVELSIKTGNYVKAIQYWNKWFKGIKVNNTITKSCCYG